MPDWFYRTCARRVFDRFDDDAARRFSVGFLRRVAGVPQGFRVVDLLGHMLPGESLKSDVGGVECRSPLALAPVIDPEGKAVDAFSRFGFGWIVVGPVGVDEPASPVRLERSADRLGVTVSGPRQALGLERARAVAVRTPEPAHLVFELELGGGGAGEMGESGEKLIGGLLGQAAAFVVSARSFADLEALDPAERRTLLGRLAGLARSAGAQFFTGLPMSFDPSSSGGFGAFVAPGGGAWVGGEAGPGDRGWWSLAAGRGALDSGLALAGEFRRWSGEAPLAVDAGVLAPREAVELARAGVDVVVLGAGLIATGPGLAKRCNEALDYDTCRRGSGSAETPVETVGGGAAVPPERRAWFWGAALGTAMLVGAVLAFWIALTKVLLPYDEAFLGKTRAELEAFSPKVLHFMTHDRITLAGTMVSIAVLYLALSVSGMRRGHHYAQRAVSVSGGIGFLTFFAFLGFGYFDPFHAFVTVVLLQFYIQMVVSPPGRRAVVSTPPLLDNDGAWRRSQWSQLLFVAQSVGLVVAGATILTVGVTVVFVPQDTAFLGMDVEALDAFDRQLKPLIAHDRATFGGMLVAAGVGLLLTTLWAFRRGDRWLWWTYALTLLPPYAMTLWIHGHIGYTDQFHLAPVYAGAALAVAALALGAQHLLRTARYP